MQAETKKTFQIYWKHTRRYPWSFVTVLLGSSAISILETYKPLLYKRFFDVLSLPGRDTGELMHILYIILVLSFGVWIAWRALFIALNFLETRVQSDLLNTCFEYLHRHSYGFFSDNFAGTLVRRVNRYTRSYEQVLDQLTFNVGQTVLRFILIFYVLFTQYWQIAIGMLIWSVIYLIIQYWFTQYKMKFNLLRSAQDSKTTGFLSDTVANNLNIKIFSALPFEFRTFKTITEKLYKIRKKTWDIGHYGEAAQAFLMVGLEFGIMAYGVQLWGRGEFTLGGFILIQSYVFQLFERIWDIGRHIQRINEAVADANEMTEILDMPHEVQDINGAKQLKVSHGAIEFKDVSFSYHENLNVIKKLNLSIRAGERVALVGPSGGGKTTITKLLLRFTDVKTGDILIDGQNIAKVTQDSLRKNIGLVPQEPILFHRTILENIQYGKPGASKDDVIKAAKLANCHNFISSLPKGYGTYVGERGIKLSGGERQRVAIARAILKNAPILVLDEATSSLDSESEHLIQDALKNLMQGKTTIVIAHRLSTIMQMDRIVVLEKGKITEQGTHDELVIARQGTYQKLWEIQAGGFA
jgi:ATP-binding cassette subfamily B protein